MSGSNPWPIWKLGLLLYPFAASAVAINLFLVGLLGPVIGLPAFTPLQALVASIFLGVPAAWAFARWVRGLIDQADR